MKYFISLLFMFVFSLNINCQELLFQENPTHYTNEEVKRFIYNLGYKIGQEDDKATSYYYSKEYKVGDGIKPTDIIVSDTFIIMKYLELDEVTDMTGGIGLSFFDSLVLSLNEMLKETPIITAKEERLWRDSRVFLMIDRRDKEESFYVVVFKR